MRYLFLVSLIVLSFSSYANQKGYDEGKDFGRGGISLGRPDKGDSKFLNQTEDVSALESLNDSNKLKEEIASKTAFPHDVLKLENDSNLLCISEKRKFDGFNAHQINGQNPFYQDTQKIEDNPLGKVNVTSTSSVKRECSEDIKQCIEGVNFNLDIERKLIFTPPPRQNQQTSITINIPDAVTTVTQQKSKRRWHGMSNKKSTSQSHQLNMGVINSHFPTYFSATDVSTQQVHNIDPKRVQQFKFLGLVDKTRQHVHILYYHDTYQNSLGSTEAWDVITPGTESILEKNNCYELKRVCLLSGDKHFDELVINRPCWHEKITYSCDSEPIDGCKHLKDRACNLQTSKCLEGANPCLKWQYTYNCTAIKDFKVQDLSGSDMFCLNGDCYTPEPKINNDMHEAIANLAALQAIKKEISFATNPPTVFKGEVGSCSHYLTDYCNCCASLKGWGGKFRAA